MRKPHNNDVCSNTYSHRSFLNHTPKKNTPLIEEATLDPVENSHLELNRTRGIVDRNVTPPTATRNLNPPENWPNIP